MNDILIMGGTGTTGRRVAQHLRERGFSTRTTSRTRGDVSLDLNAPSTWLPALDGVTAIYVLEPEIQGTEDGRRRVPRFVGTAMDAGVRRLVLLSAPGVEGNRSHPLWQVEEAVKAASEWTIVRPNWFAQNFSETFWLPGIREGALVLPTGTGATAFVDADDIADVAATALTDDGHHGQSYVLTGPRAISFGEAVDLIGRATGRAIRHVDVTPEEFVRAQVANGLPAGAAEMLAALYTSIREGKAAEVHDGVQRALGRPPKAFEDYVAEVAASGLWTKD